jgi:anaerobic ribonucleoside-triphosphate reductase
LLAGPSEKIFCGLILLWLLQKEIEAKNLVHHKKTPGGNCLKEGVPFQNIIKRDGRILPFHAQKIAQAIFKAAKAVGGEDYSLAEELTREVIAYLSAQNLPGINPAVEEIQDAVEKILIEKGHARTAKAYILYRAKRTRIREAKSELMDVVKDILIEGSHEEKESGGYSPAKKMKQVALAASQKYYLDNLLPQDLAELHQKGSFHIHQLGYYSKTIDSLKIDPASFFTKEMFFNEKHFFPVTDLSNALFIISALVQKAGDDLYGEQSLASFDTFLASLMLDLSKKPDNELLTACLRGFLSYLSVSPCFGGVVPQLKFSIALGLDTTAGGRTVTRIVLEELLRGKKEHPRIIFSLQKGVNFFSGDPNYDLYKLALKAALCCGNPSFVFLDTAYNNFPKADSCYFSDGLRVVKNRYAGVGGEKRGNLASLTINLPRLALHTGEQELFFVELDRLLRLGVRQLLHRFEVLTALKCKELPTLMGWNLYLGSESLSPEESIKESIKNGLMSLNYTGLPEAVRVLLDKDHGATAERFELAKKIAGHMARRIESFTEEYGLNFALGSVAGRELKRLVELDKKDFGLIKGVTDKTFYSSSFLLFQEDEGLEKKIALEGELHRLSSGGYASRIVLLPRMDPRAIEDLLYRLVEAEIGFLSVFRLR